jgi:hypothetical protein
MQTLELKRRITRLRPGDRLDELLDECPDATNCLFFPKFDHDGYTLFVFQGLVPMQAMKNTLREHVDGIALTPACLVRLSGHQAQLLAELEDDV